MPKKTKVKLDLKTLAVLPGYFGYIFVHQRRKAHISPNSAGKVIQKKKHFNRWRRAFFGLHLILAKKHFDFRRRPFFFSLYSISWNELRNLH